MFSYEILSRFFEYDKKTVVSFMLLEAFLAKNDKIDAAGIRAAFEEFAPLAEKIAKQYQEGRDAEAAKSPNFLIGKTIGSINNPCCSSPQMRIPTK